MPRRLRHWDISRYNADYNEIYSVLKLIGPLVDWFYFRKKNVYVCQHCSDKLEEERILIYCAIRNKTYV